MTYKGIVSISNEIRFVLDTARQVNMAAQNASLAARRAGNVWGFQTVSAELKVFSQGLTKAMHGMSQEIHGIAQAVSGGYRQIRFGNYYDNAAQIAGKIPLLENVRALSKDRYSRTLTDLRGKIRRLIHRLGQSIRICSYGRALAHSAMIEAASGGRWETMLRNVANDIERTIVQIYERLKKIDHRLYTEQQAL